MINVADLVKNDIMKDYLSSIELSIEEKISIVLYSLQSLEIKIKYLALLKEDYPDLEIIDLFYKIYKLSYDLLFNPSKDKNLIIIIANSYIDIKNDNNHIYVNDYNESVNKSFNNINEVLDYCNNDVYLDGADINLYVYDVSEKGNRKPYFLYNGHIIDNKLEIININNFELFKSDDYNFCDILYIEDYLDIINYKNNEDLLFLFDNIDLYNQRHPGYPFKNNELVKYDTKYTDEPIYGYMASEADGNDTMYCFLMDKPGGIEGNYDSTDILDFSYSTLGFSNRLPYFEYLYRATEEEIKEYEEKINL